MTGSIRGTRFDSEVDTTPCNAQTNANLTLYLRVFLQQVNPTGATGTHADADGTNVPIVRWSSGQWHHFQQRYRQICEDYWNGRVWLGTPDSYSELDWPVATPTVRPNVFCRVRVAVVNSAAGAHATIQVVRVADRVRDFRSHAGLYCQRDIEMERHRAGVTFITAVHEVGHLLGLEHSGENRSVCPPSNTNDDACYGMTPTGGILNRADYSDAMGNGRGHRGWHAQAWQETMQRHTGVSRWEWAISNVRIYPRQLSNLHHVRFGHARR